jgi:hypothetical protein
MSNSGGDDALNGGMKPKINLSYSFDSFLMYLLQDVTKRPTAEILNFFNELGRQVSEIGVEKAASTMIRKELTEYFPNTSVPFTFLMKGYHYGKSWDCRAEVTFPWRRQLRVESKDLDRIGVELMEQALLGGEQVAMPPFVKPEIRTPKMYKSLMDAFAGRPPKEKKPRAKKTKEIV